MRLLAYAFAAGISCYSSNLFAGCRPDDPPPLLICTAQCSGRFCGDTLPYLGTMHHGLYLGYGGRGTLKPIDIPQGQDQAWHAMRLQSPLEDATLYFSIDEQPDYALAVEVLDASFTVINPSDGLPNEQFELAGIKKAEYFVKIIKRETSPGGRSANYNLVTYLLPTVQSDDAGEGKSNAKNLGRIDSGGIAKAIGYLQYLNKRNGQGQPTLVPLVNDRSDWYKINLPSGGVLRGMATGGDFPVGISAKVFFEGQLGPIPLEVPQKVPAGDHYVHVDVSHGNFVSEYSSPYRLQLEFSKQ